MALYVNTSELKNQTNDILRKVARGPIVVTRHGHPCAVLVPAREETLEDLLWELSPRVQSKLNRAFQDIEKGNVIPAAQFGQKHERR